VTPQVNLSVLAPIGFLGIGAMVVLMAEVFLSQRKTLLGRPVDDRLVGTALAGIAIYFLLLTLYACCVNFASGDAEVFNPGNPLYQMDPFSSLVSAVIALGALLCCALAIYYLGELRINHGEYYALLLLSASGMLLMVGAVDFIALFLGLELMSIPIYVLAGFDRSKLTSNESAMKYFLIGSFASAIMLYGMALLYGAVGATSFEALRTGFDPESPLALVGVGLLLVGFAFKISSVPFHQWTPDVYEGAPAAVTAFMSVAVKTTAVAALLRVVGLGLGPLDDTLINVLWVLAALSMIVGNLMAVIQDNVKRLLAYSSIGHGG
jgi:NADH-quinone oxidoreductase subunit N